MRAPRRCVVLVAALLLTATSVFAQAPPVGWPTGGVTAPVVLVPSSGVNGAGVIISPGSFIAQPGSSALSGAIRLLNLNGIGWRNAANTGDLSFYLDGSNILQAQAPLTVTGAVTSTAAVIAGTSVNANAGSGFTLVGNGAIFSSAAKLIQVTESGGTTGSELNGGTPTLGACTGGTMTSGSHNIAGEVTGNTSGSCVINFGTPNFTNTPFCFANDETTLTAVRISARSASSITVTGAVSGDAFQFFCIGRIGT